MINAVITWVDGNDPVHQKKFAKYQNENADKWIHPKAKHPTRFADKNEVWYCVNSIRKYAPYIDKIFMVTDEQEPYWLTEQSKKELNIQVVDHKDIFSGYHQYLPTFNSLSIESMLHRISGISNNFLYFNDDVILNNQTQIKDYFDGDCLIYRGDWVWKIHLKRRLVRLISLNEVTKYKLMGKGFIGYRNEKDYFNRNKNLLFRLSHAPHPMNKEICEQLFTEQDVLEKQIKYRFKNKKQYSPISLAANLAMIKGKARKGPKDYGYISCSTIDVEQCNTWLDFFEHSRGIKSVCIQSLDQASPVLEDKIKSFLHKRVMQ